MNYVPVRIGPKVWSLHQIGEIIVNRLVLTRCIKVKRSS